MKTLTLQLTKEQWIELYYAVDDKLGTVKSHAEQPDDGTDMDKWALDLHRIKQEIVRVLDEEEIIF